MPIESYIPLQVKPLQLDPLGDAAKALSLQKLLLGDRLRGAFVFDETPNGPQMNLAKTRQNLYSIDPEAAMTWERQQDMRDHWLGQRAYQQATLKGAEANRALKEQSLDLQRMKAGLMQLNMDWMEDKQRTPDQKLPLYMQQYEQILRGGGNAARSYMERGLLPQKYDFNAIDKFIATPDESFVKTAAVGGAPTLMTDEGDVLSPETSGDYVETAGSTRLAPGMIDSLRTGGGTARSSKPTSRAEALAEAYILRSEAEKITGTDAASKQRKQFLMSQAKSLIELRKPWNPGEDYIWNPDTNQWEENKFATNIKERRAKAGAANLGRNEKDFSAAQKLRDDFRTDSKVFREVRDGYGRVQASLDRALKGGQINAAETLTAATAFMKMLDPGSVVRESELGMALAATGYIDRIKNLYATMKEGKVLTQAQIQNFSAMAKQLYDKAEQMQIQLENTYREDATYWGLDPKRVVPDFKIQRSKPEKVGVPNAAPKTAGQKQEKPQAKKGPAVGTVVDGYKFKGGDPGNRENWVPVK